MDRASKDQRYLAWLLRRPPLGEHCGNCACWEAFEGPDADSLGECTKPGGGAHDRFMYAHADDVCDVWEKKTSIDMHESV